MQNSALTLIRLLCEAIHEGLERPTWRNTKRGLKTKRSNNKTKTAQNNNETYNNTHTQIQLQKEKAGPNQSATDAPTSDLPKSPGEERSGSLCPGFDCMHLFDTLSCDVVCRTNIYIYIYTCIYIYIYYMYVYIYIYIYIYI